jgi:hypothetical protein
MGIQCNSCAELGHPLLTLSRRLKSTCLRKDTGTKHPCETPRPMAMNGCYIHLNGSPQISRISGWRNNTILEPEHPHPNSSSGAIPHSSTIKHLTAIYWIVEQAKGSGYVDSKSKPPTRGWEEVFIFAAVADETNCRTGNAVIFYHCPCRSSRRGATLDGNQRKFKSVFESTSVDVNGYLFPKLGLGQ